MKSIRNKKKYDECGFNKLNLCGFKPEDCAADNCDMHNIPFTAKGVLKQSKKEHKAIKELHNQLIEEKKAHGKTDLYKELKNKRNDKVVGMLKLSKAYVHLKRLKK